MRILWLTIDRSKRALQFYNDFRLAVAKKVDVDTIMREVPNPVGAFAKRLQRGEVRLGPMTTPEVMNEYDFVFSDAHFAFTNEMWSHVTVPKGVLMGDQHGSRVEWYIGEALRWRLKIFTIYRDALRTYWPNLPGYYWLPCACSPALFRPYDDVERRSIALMTGVLDVNTYPVRTAAHMQLSGRPWYEQVERPKETATGGAGPRGEDYARLLASARLAFSCTSYHQYTVTKYYEIPACGTCLVADAIPEMSALGFRPNLHYIPLDPTSSKFVRHMADLTTGDSELVDEVSEAGLDLVRSRHTYEHRANMFLNYVEEIIRS